MEVSIQEIRLAAEALSGKIVRTPFSPSQTLSEICGAKVFLKFENH
ncbi:MAG: hypothetical protein ACE5GK_07535 [Nitrospiria bacterium]